MLTFRIKQNTVDVVRATDEQHEMLREYLTLDSGVYWKVKKEHWDRKIRFYGWVSKRFGYGLWPSVRSYLKRNKIKYKAYTKRKPLRVVTPSHIGDITLDHAQRKSVGRWFKRGGSGIIWAAAGAGKTEMAATIIRVMLKRGYAHRVLFVVNGLDLLEQARERLHLRLGMGIGTISGSGVNTSKRVTVTAIQKIHNLLKNEDAATIAWLKNIDLLVYDEVHHGRSQQTVLLIKHCPARYRLGVSARPLKISHDEYKADGLEGMKADDARVLATIGPILIRVSPSELIESDRLAKPKIYLYSLGYKKWRMTDERLEKMNWQSARRTLIEDNRAIHNVARKQALRAAKAGETTLVISGGSKRLGLNVYSELQDAHLNAVYLHGGVDKNFRNLSRKRMSANKLDACVATTIYDEGVDIPRLRQLILAFGGLSPIKNEQRLGRALRTKLGANVAVVVDFMNYANKHLRKHSYARLKMYKEEELYDLYLVGRHHTPHVIRMVGKDKVVDALPNASAFKRLKNG